MKIYRTKPNPCGWRLKFKFRDGLDLSIIWELTENGHHWKESKRVGHDVFVETEYLDELLKFLQESKREGRF